MICVAQAQAIVRSQCAPLPCETLPLQLALDRVLAVDLFSPVHLPPFDNSAMDGFALRSGGQELAAGAQFLVCGEQAAGDGVSRAQGEGAWEIMTGARLPQGLDAVVPVEQVDVLARNAAGRASRIRLSAAVTPGAHIRRAGEDIALGSIAMRAGTRIGAQHVLLLAGLGIAELPLMQRPRVALLCTGRELVDDPALPLQPGQIRNSNAPFLSARLRAAGAELVHIETVPDDADAFTLALQRALGAGAGIVLSTGAVSMGRYDFVPPTLQSLGAAILFHTLRMRPGKPLLCARLTAGALYFGLPGNPVSAAVGLRFFVEQALRAQLGLAPEQAWRLPLAHAVDKKAGCQHHQKARWQLSAAGALSVALLKGQESFKTQPLLHANVWAVLPEEAEQMRAGTMIDVFALGHEQCGMLGDPP